MSQTWSIGSPSFGLLESLREQGPHDTYRQEGVYTCDSCGYCFLMCEALLTKDNEQHLCPECRAPQHYLLELGAQDLEQLIEEDWKDAFVNG